MADRRPLRDILATPPWRELAAHHDIVGLVEAGQLKMAGVRVLDKYMQFAVTKNILTPTVDDFLSFASDTQTPGRLTLLLKAVDVLMPGHPVILTLLEARLQKERICALRTGAGRIYERRVSVPDEDLPAEWLRALRDMADGSPGKKCRTPATSIQVTIRQKLCQLAWAIEQKGRPVALNPETVDIYLRALRRRTAPGGTPLRAATITACLSALDAFGRYIGADKKTRKHLRQRRKKWDRESNSETPLKWAKLEEGGGSTLDHFHKAGELLEASRQATHVCTSQMLRNSACALALFSLIPLRLADTRLVFGETLFWTGKRYRVVLELSKSDDHYRSRLHPAITRFIDALILRGADAMFLEQMREACLAKRRPLFIRHNGEQVGYNYVSDRWRQHVGYGEHAARAHVYDALSHLGDDGIALAMSLNGQRDGRTSEAYKPHTYGLKAQEFAVDTINGDFSAEDEVEYFSFG